MAMWEQQASLLSPRVREVLKTTCPMWSRSEFEAAEEKLASIGALLDITIYEPAQPAPRGLSCT